MTIRVLIVDDSAFIRRALKRVLGQDPGFEVTASAANGRLALRALEEHDIDAVVLDVEMPVMNGLEALKALREKDRFVPVVMFSTLTDRGGAATLEALSLGANDYVTKPSNHESADEAFEAVRRELIPRLRTLVEHAAPRRSRHSSTPDPSVSRPVAPVVPEATKSTEVPLPAPSARRREAAVDVVAIGVSTGGPNALQTLFSTLPADLGAPLVVVQHMPPLFTGLLAQRLNSASALEVREAVDGDVLRPGLALLAPGDHHLLIGRESGSVRVRLEQSEPVNSCRPAVDVTLRSVHEVFGGKVLAVILTGMGKDGLEGCRGLVQAGAHCFVQDAETSVVWGMPGYVAKEGLADRILPIEAIAHEITQCVRAGARAHPTPMA